MMDSSAPIRVAIQGVKACFHDVAAQNYFKDFKGVNGQNLVPVESKTFRALCENLTHHRADYAMMAIENTIAGSILPNYALLETFGLKIMGEVYLRIEMCLLALPGQAMNDIRFVQSHPMALLQCQEFLSTLSATAPSPVTLVEASDTAESALEVAQRKLTGYAAIASRLAAETYGLQLLKENIETDRANYTRFLVLARPEDYALNPLANKASIRFETRHEPGSLAQILTIFSKNGVNLTKIQSLPVIGKPYQYAFHTDIEWSLSEHYELAMQEVSRYALNIIHFGKYAAGKKGI